MNKVFFAILFLLGLGISPVANSQDLVDEGKNLPSQKIFLTPEEKSWLSKHPVIKVSNETDFPPFDFAVGNQPHGYSIDLLNLLAERIGMRVEYVNDPPWSELVELFKQGELDLLTTLSRTPEREKFLKLIGYWTY